MRVAWWLVQVVCLAFGLSASPVALAQRDDPSVGKGLTVPAAGPPPREKPDASRPRSLTYDSRTCSRDAEGMVYFAIHRRVFRQPAGNLTRIVGREPEYMRTLPLPPKPEEPEGCPDRPIQADVFYLGRFSALLGDPEAPTASRANLITLVINGGTVPVTGESTFEIFCNRNTRPDNRYPGWVGCIRTTPPFHAVYQTIEYRAPNGEKVTLLCRVGLLTDAEPRGCSGGYRLHIDLVLNYYFSLSNVSVTEFIAADREMRRRFEAAEIANYPWGTAPDGNDNRTSP